MKTLILDLKNCIDVEDVNKICRILIFLDDWKSGHYFELNGVPYTNGLKVITFGGVGMTPHIAANLGVEDRYTMQITATLEHVG